MKKVNIMIGRFQPMTKGHLKCVDEAWDKLGLPTVFAMINTPDEKVDEKHPFPSSILTPLYDDMFAKNKKVIKIILVRSANIVEIGEKLYNEGYEIASWTCGTDRVESYQKMADKYKEKAHLADDFQMLEIKRGDEDISATKVRQALLNDDKETYKKLVPQDSLKLKLKNKSSYDILREQLLKVHNK